MWDDAVVVDSGMDKGTAELKLAETACPFCDSVYPRLDSCEHFLCLTCEKDYLDGTEEAFEIGAMGESLVGYLEEFVALYPVDRGQASRLSHYWGQFGVPTKLQRLFVEALRSGEATFWLDDSAVRSEEIEADFGLLGIGGGVNRYYFHARAADFTRYTRDVMATAVTWLEEQLGDDASE